MEETPTDELRHNNRTLIAIHRQIRRDTDSDVRRSMLGLSLSSVSLANIAQKLTNKSSTSLSDLQAMKNGLLENEKNIEAVLSVHGALRGLVRELSGNDMRRQCMAVDCCCNLSLGNSKACNAVAKGAGAYLIAALDNLTTELAISCAWSIGNLASSPKATEILLSQGAVSKLVDMLGRTNEQLYEAAVYALVHITWQIKDELSEEHLDKIQQITSERDISKSSRLLFILSCHSKFKISVPILEKVLPILKNNSKLAEHQDDIVYLIRYLANSFDVSVYNYVINYFVTNNMEVEFRLLLKNDVVKESILWLFGNIFKCCGYNEFFDNVFV